MPYFPAFDVYSGTIDMRSTLKHTTKPAGKTRLEGLAQSLELQQLSTYVSRSSRDWGTLTDEYASVHPAREEGGPHNKANRSSIRLRPHSVIPPPPETRSFVPYKKKSPATAVSPSRQSYSSSSSAAAAPGGFSLPNVLSWIMSRYLVVRCLQLT